LPSHPSPNPRSPATCRNNTGILRPSLADHQSTKQAKQNKRLTLINLTLPNENQCQAHKTSNQLKKKQDIIEKELIFRTAIIKSEAKSPA
jgi:hypothetical protein